MRAGRRAPTFGASNEKEEAMAVRVAINGFGRTGRAAFRASFEREADIEWVAPDRCDHPGRHADQDREQQAQRRELEREWQPVHDRVPDRDLTPIDPEIPL